MKIDPVERQLFLEGLYLKYGYDFTQYSEASLDRRLEYLLTKSNSESLLDIIKRAIKSEDVFQHLLSDITVNTTEFFRDPQVYLSLKNNVFPILRNLDKINIWCAGCSTGQEVLSLAILLHEATLLDRTTIYATDIDSQVIKKAKSAIYEFAELVNFNKNYVVSGGNQSPSDYYTAEYGLARFDPRLLRNVVFYEHNLVTDSGFIEANLVLCRNVLIYFNRDLQNKVFGLFAKSIAENGFLTLGSKESAAFSVNGQHFTHFDHKQNILTIKPSLRIGEIL